MSESNSTPTVTPSQSHAMLGWDRVRDALARCALAEVTQQQCRQWSPEENLEAARHLLSETQEMRQLTESPQPFPLRRFDTLDPILQSARERSMVESEDCLQLMHHLRLTGEVHRYLRKKSDASLLNERASTLDPLTPLLKELDRCIDEEGEIRENASPEMKQAARDIARAKQTLENAAQKILAKSSDLLQDTYATEREGRTVLPLRADARSRLEGIVHDHSGSGQTLFVEPTALIPLNNQLKISRLTYEKEKARILAQLAREILNHQAELLENENRLIDLDLIHARALLAERMQGRHVNLHRNGPVKLNQARNPELVLNGQEVVANDIHWEETTQVIIISGPNTGGKTVTLKTVGLMALMARAGLFLPVGPDSELRFFSEVYADIGDDQNVQLELSTFSAHLAKIIHILNHAPAGALLLLDELGIATDPQEGAALAEAILLEMKRRGFMVLVSTHYTTLKTLAQAQEGFTNACTEFDTKTHRPTYRLIFGVPGHSAALETAERLGLDAPTISHARALYQKKDHRAEDLLQELHHQKRKLEEQQGDLEQKMREAEALRQEQKELVIKLKAEKRDFMKSKARRIQASVKDAQREIKKLMDRLRHAKDPASVRKVEKKLQELGRTPAAALSNPPEGWDIPGHRLKEGDTVLVENYDAFGVLLENPEGKPRVRVLLGNLPTVVETRRLFGHARGEAPKGHSRQAPGIQIHTEAQSQTQTSCDLRGMRVEEARDQLEVFLSRAVVNKLSRVTIIHGHGMGKVKQMVRDYLGSAGIGKSHLPGERHEGGDGVTVVEF